MGHYDISSELSLLRRERDEYRSMYIRAAKEIDSLHRRLAEEVEINDKYRDWFRYHEYWVLHHNNMIKYNPELGVPDLPGGSDPIDPPLRPSFDIVPGTRVKGKVMHTSEDEPVDVE